MKRTTKWLLFGGAIVASAAVVLGMTLSPGVPVEVARATPGAIRQFIDERGKTRLPETTLLTMPYNGRIESIEVVEGTPVQKDQVLARVVPLDLELNVRQSSAVVERLEAALTENAFQALEQTALKQADQFVASMESTVQAARARVDSGKARLDYTEKNLARISGLYEKKAVSQDDFERATLDNIQAGVEYRQDKLVYTAMQAAQAATNLLPTMVKQYIERKNLTGAVLEKQRAEAEAQLAEVREAQRRGTMTSPIDGVVLQRAITNERYLAAGTTLLELGRLEDMEVEADVLSVEVVNAYEGCPVEIYGPAIGEPLAHGTIKRIYPAGFTKISSLGVEQQQVKVIVSFDPDDLARLRQQRHLGVGYQVRVRIITADRSQVLTVPRSALFRGLDGHRQLYAVQDGRAQMREVQAGLINDEQVEITGGLASGDLVIVAPESNLRSGQRVEPKVLPSRD